MIWKPFLVAMALASTSMGATFAHAECTYNLNADGVQAEWTAFKFTSKAPVKGNFADTTLEGPREAKTLTALAGGLSMKIVGKSVKTGNPGRDATVAGFFFAFMKDGGNITGKATKVEGDDTSGTVHIDITMNGETRDVPFAYTIGKDGTVAAKASIDILDFRMKPAYDQIHKACEGQHTGDDGISKTWTQVDLALRGNFTSNCG
jgi:polyisoprenoid-binding protein YceI